MNAVGGSEGYATVTSPSGLEVLAESDDPPNSEHDEPPKSKRHPIWEDVPDLFWDDWRWQSQNAIRTTDQLSKLLLFSDTELDALRKLADQYKLAIPPYYFSLIDPRDPDDPIRRQSVASPLELRGLGTEEEDPLDEEKDSPVPGLTHRYPDRCLMVTTHVCTMYCRFCTRKRATMKRGGWDAISRDDERMIEYVRHHPEIHDVIVSGGDPLTLPTAKLRFFLEQITAIEHVGVIRLGTRVPVTLPQRVYDPELLGVIERSSKVWIQTHFNHPREVTPEAARACRNLIRTGSPLNNHTVLLKGVNDSVATMRELCRALLRAKVRPYYLFHCDPVMGAAHFRTSVWKGIEIIEGLRGHISGLGVPTYVVDAPRGGGKIPLMPNYLVSASDDAVVLRNYEGMLVRYNPDGHAEQHRHLATQGVSALLEGHQEVLLPESNARMQRRKANSHTSDLHASNAQDSNGSSNSRARRRIRVAETGTTRPATPTPPIVESELVPLVAEATFRTNRNGGRRKKATAV